MSKHENSSLKAKAATRPFFRFIIVFASVLALTFILDDALFNRLIFVPEYKGGWESFRWYAFEKEYRSAHERMDRDKERKRKRVLFVGSSISQYSFQRELLKANLKEKLKADAEVELFSHSAQMPSDLYHYRKKIKSLKPDIIVYITNPADIDLERYVPPAEAGPDYSDISHIHYLDIRRPMEMFYPAEFAREFYPYLSPERVATLVAKSTLHVSRIKDEWWDPIKFNFSYDRYPVKSYSGYRGISIPEGLYRDGLTGHCFRIPLSAIKDRTVYWQIPFELFTPDKSSPLPLTIQVYKWDRSQPRQKSFPLQSAIDKIQRGETLSYGEAQLFSDSALFKRDSSCPKENASLLLDTFTPPRAGWQSYRFPDELFHSDQEWVYIKLSHVSDARKQRLKVLPASTRFYGRGLRLTGNFGMDKTKGDGLYNRMFTLEDERLFSLKEKDYAEDFSSRIEPDDWRTRRELSQFNHLRIAKYYTNVYSFKPPPQMDYLKRFLDFFLSDTKVLVVNNPENPYTRDAYGKEWYNGYLSWMKNASSSGNYRFTDMHTLGEANEFIDAHHLTFIGSARMSRIYAEAIAALLNSP